MLELECPKEGLTGRDLGSQGEALRPSALVGLDCACGAGSGRDVLAPPNCWGQEVWVWPGLAESGAGPRPRQGRKWPWTPAGMGWPLRGRFLPGNILPRQQQGRGLSLGGQEGPGAQCALRQGPGRSQEGMTSWMSEPQQLKGQLGLPSPPTWSSWAPPSG